MIHVSVNLLNDEQGINRYCLSITPIHKGRQPSLIEDNSYDFKLSSSLSRTRTSAIAYALCNDFTHFCTFTFDPELVSDRTDYSEVKNKLTKFFNNYRNRVSPDFRYLVIPELHEDGESIHFHGLCKGIVDFEVPATIFKRSIPRDIKSPMIEVPNTKGYTRWKSYKYGFFDCSPINSKLAISNYISAYVTKDLCSKFPKNSKILLKSNDLRKPTQLYSFDAIYDKDFKNTSIDFKDLYSLAYTKGTGVFVKQYEYATCFYIEDMRNGENVGIEIAEDIINNYLN